MSPADASESRSGVVRARPANFQQVVTEATVSVADKLTALITASEAGQRNACDVCARQTDLTEEATSHETDRRAVPTEAGKMSMGRSSNQTLFCRLTPELSRPVAGRRTRASVAYSTWPTPRHGVGLNELLGGGGCRCAPSPNVLAENRSGKARTRTSELSAGCNRSDRISRAKLTAPTTVSEAGERNACEV